MISSYPMFFFLICVGLLGLFSKDFTIVYAVMLLIVVMILPFDSIFPFVEKHGIKIGIFILTVSVLAPFASGKINQNDLLSVLTNWKTLITIPVGIRVSFLASRGVATLSANPTVIPGILLGTIIGVAAFKGTPVGPLIAAGILSLIISHY